MAMNDSEPAGAARERGFRIVRTAGMCIVGVCQECRSIFQRSSTARSRRRSCLLRSSCRKRSALNSAVRSSSKKRTATSPS